MKVFVSVGTQLPFLRLVGYVEKALADVEADVFMQVGIGGHSIYEHSELLSHKEFENRLIGCDIFISHLGMGSILTAKQYKKRALFMPRRFSLGEHRNDHQAEIVKYVIDIEGVNVGENYEDVNDFLARYRSATSFKEEGPYQNNILFEVIESLL